jgi:hypothetical protein
MPGRWWIMMGALALLAGAAGPSLADGTAVTGRGVAVERACGGDAFSFAEVAPPRRRPGPLHTVPDTLCADLEDHRPPAIGSLNVVIEPPGRRAVDGERTPDTRRPWPF